jgi:hypothetical protein
MREHVDVYVAHCRALMARCIGDWWVERQFDLAKLQPPAPMYGTSDFVAYEAKARVLHVVDLKYGAGVPVEVNGNPQLRYYALGALLSLDSTLYPVDHVEITIVQPRAHHSDGAVRSERIDVVSLIEFGAELIAAANIALSPDAPLVPGAKQCRFCPAAGVCPAQRDHAQSLAQIEFAVEPNLPPAPETMPIEMVVEMLPQLDVLEDWIRAMRAHVSARLEAGIDVPGYKLVMKRAMRRWIDEAGVVQMLTSLGYEPDEMYERSLKSPAQIEKLLGKRDFADHLAFLTEKKSSGTKMVPASDPAPAVVITRGEEFALISEGEQPHRTTQRGNE